MQTQDNSTSQSASDSSPTKDKRDEDVQHHASDSGSDLEPSNVCSRSFCLPAIFWSPRRSSLSLQIPSSDSSSLKRSIDAAVSILFPLELVRNRRVRRPPPPRSYDSRPPRRSPLAAFQRSPPNRRYFPLPDSIWSRRSRKLLPPFPSPSPPSRELQPRTFPPSWTESWPPNSPPSWSPPSPTRPRTNSSWGTRRSTSCTPTSWSRALPPWWPTIPTPSPTTPPSPWEWTLCTAVWTSLPPPALDSLYAQPAYGSVPNAAYYGVEGAGAVKYPASYYPPVPNQDLHPLSRVVPTMPVVKPTPPSVSNALLDVKEKIGGLATTTAPTKANPINFTMCNCKKSKCLKLYAFYALGDLCRYCLCFSRNIFCNEHCQCTNCHNTLVYTKEREKIVSNILRKDPYTFKTVVGSNGNVWTFVEKSLDRWSPPANRVVAASERSVWRSTVSVMLKEFLVAVTVRVLDARIMDRDMKWFSSHWWRGSIVFLL